jgi:hypothetical protein
MIKHSELSSNKNFPNLICTVPDFQWIYLDAVYCDFVMNSDEDSHTNSVFPE